MVQNVEFRLLSCFFGQDSRRFAELCRIMGFPTDLGGYYIRNLVKDGYLTRSDRGTYTITLKGKQQLVASYGREPFVNRSRFCTMIVARQGDTFITLERTRQPFIGTTEWPAGALMHGETLPEATARVLRERLGITGKPAFRGMFRRIDIYKDTVFDDKLFAVHTLLIPAEATLPEHGLTGKNILYSQAALSAVAHPSKSLLDILEFSMGGDSYSEHTYQLQPDDLFLSQKPPQAPRQKRGQTTYE